MGEAGSPPPFFSQRLGRYTILKQLERGGMASIDLAVRDGSDRLCVIKRLHNLDPKKSYVEKRFHREAKLASMLSHDNLACVFDAGVEDGVFCLVSEFVPGKTLAAFRSELSHREELVPFDLVVHIGAEILSALAYVHRAEDEAGQPLHLVHRDLSARNIMVSFDGAVKLIDFGLAKADVDDFQTAQGTVLGTFPYLSPEQAVGRDVDGRSDLYSLSVILFESLTGRALIPRTKPAEMLPKILHDPPPPHSVFPPEVPAALRSVVIRGLAKALDKRWQSAGEYRDAMLAAAGPIEGSPKARIARALADLFPSDAAQIQKLISFYAFGEDGGRTAIGRSNSDFREDDTYVLPRDPAEEPREASSSEPSVTVPAVEAAPRARSPALPIAFLVIGWLVGWLLSRHLV
jgi:serine/threonine protein kinase